MTTEYEGEECQRCGAVGEDRRTLWMACLYAMHELHVPFDQVMLRGTAHEHTGERDTQYGFKVPVYADEPTGEPRDRPFYTLRVCKDCRADWMAVIKAWFNSPPMDRTGCGSGIFVRENGVNVEITLDEWERRRAQEDRGE